MSAEDGFGTAGMAIHESFKLAQGKRMHGAVHFPSFEQPSDASLDGNGLCHVECFA